MSTPLQQRIVPFYGDELVAVQQPDGTIFVLFSRLCENLGLERTSQIRRIQRHAVLSRALIMLDVQTLGGIQALQCLKLTLLPLWLSGVQASRIKSELQEQLIRYQEEAADALWQAFKPQILMEERDDELAVSTDAELVQLAQIAEMGRAITRMAEEQLELRRRVDAAARAFKTMRADIMDVQIRLGVLEDKLHPAAYITDTQAAEVSSRVKALAELLTGKDSSKNHYQGIFGELYRRYGVASYKTIRVEQYAAVLAFLEDWRNVASSAS
jgi:hypothetical protein